MLIAQPFDLGHLEPRGEPFAVQEGVEEDPTWWLGVFSVSQNGLLAFSPNPSSGNQIVLLNPNGKQIGTVAEPGRYTSLRLSPNGQQVALESDQPQHEIWIYDLRRNLATQFTLGPTANALPAWSQDGKQIAFGAEHGGHTDLYAKSVAGAQTEEALLETNSRAYPLDWSPDGNFLLYYVTNESNTINELWALPMRGPRAPRLLLRSPSMTQMVGFLQTCTGLPTPLESRVQRKCS